MQYGSLLHTLFYTSFATKTEIKMKRKRDTGGVLCVFLIAVSYNVLVNVNIQSHSAYVAENTTTFISVNLYIDNKQEKK
ncbi:hypothetical protein QD69_07140 [Salmonella enterica]|nr:hypothetical protein [Salmonella enterica]EBD7296383.1 hypothetical protein [Salmonella enterica subsp. enterica]ECB7828750.1 hypothetical protein [Salmonella enterica subsp. enterica serovar Jodhpur]ECJ6060516.1 hypothetical protein [Salmonella enterica]ECP7741001.1 hypothetical protein [Salmonella enterica subsp. enterica serovar Jodhpur]